MSTNDPMPQERLDAIQEREAKATAGPWGVEGPAQCGPSDTLVVYPVEDGGALAYVQPSWDDAEFIAHARQDVSALLAEVERLQPFESIVSWRYGDTTDGRTREDMVERAAQQLWAEMDTWASAAWCNEWARQPEHTRNAYRSHVRAVLDAALNPREGS